MHHHKVFNWLLLVFFLLATFFPLGCNDAVGQVVTSMTLLSHTEFATGTKYNGYLIFGLSGVDYDKSTQRFLSERDNYLSGSGNNGNQVAFSLAPVFSSAPGYTLELRDVNLLGGISYASGLESIRYDPAGDGVWLAGEAANTVYHLNAKGARTSLTLPEDVAGRTPAGASNYGIEGLTFASDSSLWVSREDPLSGDTPDTIRLSQIDPNTGAVLRQYAYRLDNVRAVQTSGNSLIANPPGSGVGNNGVSEILATGNGHFLVMERGFDGVSASTAPTGTSHNYIRIYSVDISTGTDVKSISYLNGTAYTPVTKTPIFNSQSSEIVEALNTYATKVDNIEGMSFGPDLPNGDRSIVLVSDNNNSSGQRKTQFLVFDATFQKATPVITTPPTASTLTYGQSLASSSLTNGVASIAGTFAWTDPATTPSAGTTGYSVTFTPTDSASYDTVALTVDVTVAKATPKITASPIASPLVFGQSLSASTLSGGLGSVPGLFSWTAPNTMPPVGTASYPVLFTPDDTADYATAVTAATVLTAKASLTFASITAPNIVYGTTQNTLTANLNYAGSATPTGNVSFQVDDGPSVRAVCVGSSPLMRCTANYNTANFAVGVHTVTAQSAASAEYVAATATGTMTVTAASQTITFTQPTSPIIYGATTMVALRATGGASSNAVTFSVASGPGTINGNVLTITGAGTVLINADQAANSNYAAATTVQKSIVVGKASATLSGPAAQPVAILTQQVGAVPVTIAGQYSGPGITAPSGAIAYSVNNASSASVASGSLSIASGAVSVPVASTLAPGNYTVTLNYAGDTNYAAATAIAVALQVGQIQPTITWATPSAPTYGAPLASVLNAQAYNGSITVAGTYAYLNGATAVTAATVLPAGSYTLTVNFTPTDSTTYKTATGTVALTVNKSAVTAALVSTVSVVLSQNPVTFTATVASSVSAPTGSVTFLDGATPLATVALSGGAASLTTSALSIGTHSITAVYAGDTNFITQTTAATSVQVTDFTFNINGGGTQSTIPGGTATYSFTLTPTGTTTFPAAIAFTLSGLPSGFTYTTTPSTVAAGMSAVTPVLTIQVPKQIAMMHKAERIAPLALGMLLLPFGAALRRRAGRLSKLVALLILFIGGAASVATLTGCGASNGFLSQPETTYNLTLTSTSGSLQHSVPVTLTVQ